jgi:hypothetical protein
MIVLHSLDYIVFIRQERGIALKYLIFHKSSTPISTRGRPIAHTTIIPTNKPFVKRF